MRKVVAAINMTLDNVFDHTVQVADKALHEHYAELIVEADVLLYGRKTYELMKYWKTIAETPSGEKDMDDFALVMDRVPKIVFSHTLTDTGWHSATLAKDDLQKEVIALSQQEGKNILIGSRSLIIALLNSMLVDELQMTVHPIIAANGPSFFENIDGSIRLKLLRTKVFASGAVTLFYQPVRK